MNRIKKEWNGMAYIAKWQIRLNALRLMSSHWNKSQIIWCRSILLCALFCSASFPFFETVSRIQSLGDKEQKNARDRERVERCIRKGGWDGGEGRRGFRNRMLCSAKWRNDLIIYVESIKWMVVSFWKMKLCAHRSLFAISPLRALCFIPNRN